MNHTAEIAAGSPPCDAKDGGDLTVSPDERLRRLERELAIATSLARQLRSELAVRLAAEEEGRRYQSLLAATLEATVDGILVVDVGGNIATYNRQFLELWQVPESVIAPRRSDTLLAFVAEQLCSPEAFVSRVRELYRTPEASAMDELRFKDGRIFDRYSQPQRVGDIIVGRLWSFRDVTARKQAEESLRRREEYFRALIENSLDIISVIDADGRIQPGSPSLERFLGYPPGEIHGKPFLGVVHPEDADRIHRAFLDICHFVPVKGQEARFLHKDGSWRMLEVFGRNLLSDPSVKGVVVNARDITSRKQLEAQFLQAQKMEAVGQLAGGVAHDFNNILAAFMLQLDLLQRRADLAPEIRSGLDELSQGAHRAASLTRQLLLFSRQQALQPRPLELGRLVGDLMKMLHRVLGEHVELVFVPSPEPACLKADPAMIEQVIMNLCLNARDAMPDGGRIQLRVEVVTIPSAAWPWIPPRRSGRFACLTVADSGCGMDAATLKRIFEPFFTTKPVGSGTGLGLATVHGIIDLHEGWTDVVSAVGQGTTFRVFLPAVEASALEPARPQPVEAPRGTETILVVEDDPSLRQTIRASLQLFGYTVIEAKDGPEALRLAEHEAGRIGLVFTDIVMPGGMTGLQLALRLRELRNDLKVLISSGYSVGSAEVGGPWPAGLRLLPKPYHPAVLAREVRNCLDGIG